MTTRRGDIGVYVSALGVVTPVNEDTLTRWIKNPPALKPSTAMPNYGLSDEQVHDIVQWLLTLKCQPNQPACP